MKNLIYLLFVLTLFSCGAKRNSATTVYNVSYIYLDGKKLTKEEIDAKREQIIAEYKAGATFESLIEKYNMDHNPQAASFTFKADGIVPEFTEAVKNNRPGKVFMIDVPTNKWYYVVRRNKDSK